MYSWEDATIDDYKPIPYHKGWKKCPKCKEIPRLWIFDNGKFAKCRCRHRFEGAPVRSESILSFVKRNKGSLHGYDNNILRIKWNVWVMMGFDQSKLPEGIW